MLLNDQGKQWTAPIWGTQMLAIRKAANLPRETVAYSLRHYYISKALLASVSVQLIEKNCGTSMEMITKFYAKFLPSDQVEMLNRVELLPSSYIEQKPGGKAPASTL
jgi:hypothetical protein